MLNSVYAETVWSRRNSLLLYTIGLGLLVALTVAVYPSVREDSEIFTELLEFLPEGMTAFFGSSDISELLSPAGFVNARVNASIGTVVLAVFAISLGTAAIAGEEDRRTMDLILATPTPRSRIVIERFGAMVTLVSIVAAVIGVVMIIANPIVELGFSLGNMIASSLELALAALVFGSLALAVGGVSGHRGLTVGVASGMTVAAFFINGLAGLVEWLQGPQKLTPFYWLQRSDPLSNGLSIEDTVIMVVVITVFLGIALWGFERRDITV